MDKNVLKLQKYVLNEMAQFYGNIELYTIKINILLKIYPIMV